MNENQNNNQTKSTFDLTSFKRAQEKMIATSDRAWDPPYASRRYLTQIRDYKPEEIDRIVESGSLSEQQKLSRNYFYKDGFYKRILIYYATLLKYSGLLIPNPATGKKLSDPFISKKYNNAMDFVERLSLPTMLTNCSINALIDGSYYGVIQTLDKSNFALLDLPGEYCCSRFKDIKGNDIIEFDVRYFNAILNEDSKNEALAIYPKVISNHYRRWLKGKELTSWVKIPSDVGVCFPLFDGRPLFLNVIPATIQYDEAVETERERDLEEIRKIIVQKIPHLQDGGLLFEPEEAAEIHEGTVRMMGKNKNVSVLTTYADVDSIVSKTTADSVSNNLDKMVQNIYYEGGVSGQIFAATGNLSIETSIKNDTALMMVLGNKYSTFITNLINKLYSNTNINFKYSLLPITYYNESTYITDSFKLAQSGYSFLMPALALGLSQRDLSNVKDLENTLLKLGDKLKPLNSAYTQSSNGKVGTPEKPIEEKSPKTIQNEESLDRQGGSK